MLSTSGQRMEEKRKMLEKERYGLVEMKQKVILEHKGIVEKINEHLHTVNEQILSLLCSSSGTMRPGGDRNRPSKNKKRGRPIKSMSVGNGETIMEKRGRGRPRKFPRTEPSSTTETGTPVKKRGRGRPRKNPLEETNVGTETEAPVEKKPRGRPRKNPLEEINAGTETEAPVGKKRRGRPRKNPLKETNVGTETEAPAEKKRRGRPRKNPLKESNGGKETETHVEKRGLGRPRKFPGREIGTSLEPEEPTEDEIVDSQNEHADIALKNDNVLNSGSKSMGELSVILVDKQSKNCDDKSADVTTTYENLGAPDKLTYENLEPQTNSKEESPDISTKEPSPGKL